MLPATKMWKIVVYYISYYLILNPWIMMTESVFINESQYLYSCYQASNVNINQSTFCHHVTWGAAHLFPRLTYSPYRYGSPISYNTQASYASETYDELYSKASKRSSHCQKALEWLVCGDAFPYCPINGLSSSSISFLPICRQHCQMVKDLCDISSSLNCQAFSKDNCMVYVPQNYYLIPPKQQGSLSALPWFYLALTAFWGFIYLLWLIIYKWYRVKPIPSAISALGVIFILRLISCSVAYWFWESCASFAGLCEFDKAYDTLAILQALEALQYMVLVFVTRNMPTVSDLSIQEISAAWFLDLIFFVISFALRAVILRAPSLYWIVMTSLLYFFVFYTMVSLAAHEWKRGKLQYERIMIHAPPEVKDACRIKYTIQSALLTVIVLLLAVETCTQTMFALEVPVQILLFFYELSLVCLFMGLFYFLRPRRWSPFYFMEPAPFVLLQAAAEMVRPIGIVKVFGVKQSTANIDPSCPEEVELAPLIHGPEGRERQSLSMLIQPDGSLQVGTQST